MKKEIRLVDAERGIVQITTVDERFYARPSVDPITGLPCYEYVPSVTWVCGFYPKGVAYHKWLAALGWNEAEAVKQAGADKGSRLHQAMARLLEGETIQMDAVFPSQDAEPAELTSEEYAALLSFADWWQSLIKPEVLAKDLVVWGDGYAGTLDLLVRIDGRVWLIDFKTGQNLFPEHELQVTAYRDALPVEPLLTKPDGAVLLGTVLLPDLGELMRGMVGLAILQVGYRKNQRGWKFTEVEYQPALFAAARAIWAKETAGQKPVQKDYPLSIRLDTPVPEREAKKPRKPRVRAA